MAGGAGGDRAGDLAALINKVEDEILRLEEVARRERGIANRVRSLEYKIISAIASWVVTFTL